MYEKRVVHYSSVYGSSASSDEDFSSSASERDGDLKNKKLVKKIKKAKILYFKPIQLQFMYQGYIYNRVNKGTWRWRCANCNGCAQKTKGKYIFKERASKCNL